MTHATSASAAPAVASASRNAVPAASVNRTPVSTIARPTSRVSSITTALVWVDPTSTPPTNISLTSPPAPGQRLDKRVDPVLELRIRPHPRVHKVRLDEQPRNVEMGAQPLADVRET